MPYATNKAVLREAGLYERQVGELLSGAVNGSNKDFTVAHKPLAPYGNDADVAVNDVTAYIDGSVATVTAVNATTGVLTLQTAPATGQEVTADYSYSAVLQADVTGVIQEADAYIDESLEGITFDTASATVRKISRFYAAGLLMSAEYGLQAITEESTKEGKRKIDQAEKWLIEYRERLINTGANEGGYAGPRSSADKRLFEKYDSSNERWDPLSDTSIDVQRTT